MTIDPSRTHWFKSSYSGSQNECVEISWLAGGHVGVRDSKNSTGPVLTFTPGEWDAFMAGVQDGEFNRPDA
ncbi:DUF397 domain-containing protein [Nocardia vinacea]|uniref:DUF397 domain-containing protein n=1 Tax=Nocardia vinacea TaxID=96468 RepID=UPI00030C7790|nr:DUF397 domain-containing protein [Nocardia vinacea]